MANEGAGTSLDVDRAVSEAVARAMSTITDSVSSVIDTRLQAFKQDNSQTVEAAVRHAKHDRYEFKSRGNKQQYEHEEDVLEKMESARDSMAARQLDRAKRSLDEGIALVNKRMKVIKMADKSQYSWATVEEYLSDELASDTDDEKRIIRYEKRTARKSKEAKRKRTYRNRSNFRPDRPSASSCFQGANQPTSQLQFNRGEPHWRPHGVSNSRQEGPCYKLSICSVLTKLSCKLFAYG